MSRKTPASRSQGTRERPCGQFVKLSESLNARLHEAIEREHRPSVQSALLDAIEKWIEASERKQREREAAKERHPPEPERRRPDPNFGLGLRRREPAPPPAPTVPPPPSSSIVVTTAASSADTDLDTLAAYVVRGGESWQRPIRRRTAEDVIEATSTSREERARRARELDVRIAKMEPAKSPKTSGIPPLFKGLFDR